jgi:hypothetical protein
MGVSVNGGISDTLQYKFTLERELSTVEGAEVI